ncbi:MAG: hypothetical protein AB1544_08435 [Pseudomonadota bacterium]|jgi:hypothetical protein
MKQIVLGICISLLALAGGCSTITQSKTQRVAVTTTHEGKPVQDGYCSLTNDKGTWVTTSPGQVDVRKSNENLNVVCKKKGMVDGMLIAISRAAGSMWGNIIFGGAVGALVDHNYGPGYDYPNHLPVEMEKSITVDKNNEKQQPPAASPAPTFNRLEPVAP